MDFVMLVKGKTNSSEQANSASLVAWKLDSYDRKPRACRLCGRRIRDDRKLFEGLRISMKTSPSILETSIGLVILLVLSTIAIGVFMKQSRYDASIYQPELQVKEGLIPLSAATASASKLDAYLPENMMALTALENFGPDNLSDKIDGKAELYLSAGFARLRSQRFVDQTNPETWMEVFVYDMGSLQNAFAVYSMQKRPDTERLDVTPFAYRTENALFFVQGSEYVEIVGAANTEALVSDMLRFARSFVGDKSIAGETLNILQLFPAENLDETSISLLASDVFGFERFNNVFVARYRMGGMEMTAFLSLRDTPQEAEELAAAYYRLLGENGATDVPTTIAIPGVKLLQVFDTYELIFHNGKQLAGVHEAESREGAEELALMLQRKLLEIGK